MTVRWRGGSCRTSRQMASRRLSRGVLDGAGAAGLGDGQFPVDGPAPPGGVRVDQHFAYVKVWPLQQADPPPAGVGLGQHILDEVLGSMLVTGQQAREADQGRSAR
jgi:hypothetical protein